MSKSKVAYWCEHPYLTMPLYYNPVRYAKERSVESLSIYFSHIPKTSGSYISKIMSGLNLIEVLSSRNPPPIRISLQHLPLQTARRLIDFKRVTYCFCFVRHPYERFWSEYVYQMTIRRELGLDQPDFREWACMVFSTLRKDPLAYDAHLLPQHYYVNKHIEVFKYELGYIQWAEYHNRQVGSTFAIDRSSIEYTPRKDSGIIYDNKIIYQVQKYYARDYEKFDYRLI